MRTLITVILIMILAIGIFFFMYAFVFKKKINKDEIKYQLNEFKKSRALLGTISIVIALILCFVLTPSFNKALNKRVKIFEATREIKAGEKITSNMYKEVEIGGYNLSNLIIKDKNELENKYVINNVLKGQYFFSNNMSEEIPFENEYLYKNLTGLNRAISFSVRNLANGLSNKLIQGDIISIIFVDNNSNNRQALDNAIILDELKYVEVLTTTNNNGIDTKAIDSKNNDDKIYQTITVLVNDEQAKLIAGAEITKQIYTELVYRKGNPIIANYYLEKQQKILNELYPNRTENKEIEEIKKLLEENNNKNDTTTEYDTDLSNLNNILENAISNTDNTKNEIEETKEEPTKVKNLEEEEYERIKAELNAN